MYAKFFKRLLDFFISLCAIIVLSPVFLVLIIAGAAEMKGDPFFTQERPGLNEKIFRLVKFRTMTNERDANGELLPDEDEIAVRCVKSYDEERFCHIVRPKQGETIRFVKLNHYPNGHVQEIKYKFGDGYLFLFADEHDLILTKSVCDLFEEDDTPIPVRDPSVLFE